MGHLKQDFTKGERRLVAHPGPYNSTYKKFRWDYPNGDASLAISGGTPELAWSAPNGLFDGRDIIISSNMHTFEQPTKLAHIGFGNGWLDNAADGTRFVDHSVNTVLGTANFDAEDPVATSRRSVVTIDGVKYLKSTLTANNPGLENAGCIDFDSGDSFQPGQHTFMYNRARVVRRPEDVGISMQLKQFRISSQKYLGATHLQGNSVYLKHDQGGGGGAVCYEGDYANGSRVYYFGNGGVLADGYLTDFAWTWIQNTPDMHDGKQYFLTGKNGQCLKNIASHSSLTPNNPTGVIKSDSPLLPRFMKIQDYYGNTTAGAIDVFRTDIFMQLNGSVFLICDNPNANSYTKFCPLVPKQFNGGNSWTLTLWKGQLSDYSNAAIVMLDKTLSFVAGASLGA